MTKSLKDFLILSDGSMIKLSTITHIHINCVNKCRLCIGGGIPWAITYPTPDQAQEALANLVSQLASNEKKEF